MSDEKDSKPLQPESKSDAPMSQPGPQPVAAPTFILPEREFKTTPLETSIGELEAKKKADAKTEPPVKGGQISRTDLTKRLRAYGPTPIVLENLSDEVWDSLQLDMYVDVPALLARFERLASLTRHLQADFTEPWQFLFLAKANIATLEMAKVNFDDEIKSNLSVAPIHYAALCADPQTFEYVCRKTKDLACADIMGLNPAHYAAMAGDYKRVEELVKRMPDKFGPTAYALQITPLQYMVKSGSVEGVACLIQLGFEPSVSMLCEAAALDGTAVIHCLLNRMEVTGRDEVFRSDKWSFDALENAIKADDQALIEWILCKYSQTYSTLNAENSIYDPIYTRQHVFLTDEKINQLFSLAVKERRFKAIELLIRLGLDPKAHGYAFPNTLLHYMAADGHYEEMIKLIDTFTFQGDLIDARNRLKETPLFDLARSPCGHKLREMTKNLRANPKAMDARKRTVLFALAEGGHYQELVEFANAYGLDVYAKDTDGQTPLSVMAQKGNYKGVFYLCTQLWTDEAQFRRVAMPALIDAIVTNSHTWTRRTHPTDSLDPYYATVACLVHFLNPVKTADALYSAASRGDYLMMQHLILLGCDPNEILNGTLVERATKSGDNACINFCLDTAYMDKLYQVGQFAKIARKLQENRDLFVALGIPSGLISMIVSYWDPDITAALFVDAPQNVFLPDPLLSVMCPRFEPRIREALAIYKPSFYTTLPPAPLPVHAATRPQTDAIIADLSSMARSDEDLNVALYQEIMRRGLWYVLGPLFKFITTANEDPFQQLQAKQFLSSVMEPRLTLAGIWNQLKIALEGLKASKRETKGQEGFSRYYHILLQSFMLVLDEYYFRRLQQHEESTVDEKTAGATFDAQDLAMQEFYDDITHCLALYSLDEHLSQNIRVAYGKTVKHRGYSGIVKLTPDEFHNRIQQLRLTVEVGHTYKIENAPLMNTPVSDAKASAPPAPSATQTVYEPLDKPERKNVRKVVAFEAGKINIPKLEHYFRGKTIRGGNVLEAFTKDNKDNLGQTGTFNITSLYAAAQILEGFGLGPELVHSVEAVDRLHSAEIFYKTVPATVRYLLMILPTNDNQHAVPVVIDLQEGQIYAVDPKMSEYADEARVKLESLVTMQGCVVKDFAIHMPEKRHEPQQTDDESCALLGCMDLVGKTIGLQWPSFADLRGKLNGLSADAMKLVESIHVDEHWSAIAPKTSDQLVCYKFAMLQAHEEVIVKQKMLDEQAQALAAQKEADKAKDQKQDGKSSPNRASAAPKAPTSQFLEEFAQYTKKPTSGGPPVSNPPP